MEWKRYMAVLLAASVALAAPIAVVASDGGSSLNQTENVSAEDGDSVDPEDPEAKKEAEDQEGTKGTDTGKESDQEGSSSSESGTTGGSKDSEQDPGTSGSDTKKDTDTDSKKDESETTQTGAEKESEKAQDNKQSGEDSGQKKDEEESGKKSEQTAGENPSSDKKPVKENKTADSETDKKSGQNTGVEEKEKTSESESSDKTNKKSESAKKKVKKAKKKKSSKKKKSKKKTAKTTKKKTVKTKTSTRKTRRIAVPKGKLVPAPVLEHGFRFWTVAADETYATEDVYVHEEMNEESKAVGILRKDNLCYRLREESKDWLYVESGEVRGFVQADKLLSGKALEQKKDEIRLKMEKISKEAEKESVDASEITQKEAEKETADASENTQKEAEKETADASENTQKEAEKETADASENAQKEAKKSAEKADAANEDPTVSTEADLEEVATIGEALVPKEENAAYAHYHATVYQTVVTKDPALAVGEKVKILEKGKKGARVIGEMKEGALCYVIADKEEDYIYVESGDVRGFVKRKNLKLSNTEAEDNLLTKPESEYDLAKELVKPQDNKALYYTITSTKSGVPNGLVRNSIIEYASQFIGNPYVWGGTSLTHGADCSGFVQSIYAQYNVKLPRTSREQATVGTAIAVEDAQPGDLIFYGNGDRIYHVVIYAGDGKTVEAKSEKYGIVSANVNYSRAVRAVRVLDDKTALSFDIPKGLGSVHTFMGWQKVTNRHSQQYAFREEAGMSFDPEGFAVVDNRYVIACTTTFGKIGDYVNFYQDDGTVIPCIIGDFKNQNDEGCNAYGHLNGDCIVEFVVDENSWYGKNHANPGTKSCHPEWNHDIVRVENAGSFYDQDTYEEEQPQTEEETPKKKTISSVW